MLRSCFKSPDIENIKLPPLAPIPTDGIYEGLVAGYPRIAGEMSVKPQLALFRRFGALNARNLMYLQNDLANLERALKEFECADSLDARGKKQLYARDYHTLDCSSRDSDTAQLNIFLRVREKLKEYNEALVLQSLIHKLQTPEQHDVDDMQKFLMEIGNPLLGAEVYTWGTVDAPECFEHDLITLCPRPKQDRFSRFLTENLTWMFRCVFRRKRKGTSDPNIAYYDTTVFKWTLALTGVLAPVLLIAPIIFLVLKVTSKTMRLWVVGIVNVVLGLCLTFFTEATRKDVFAVTAAFAAVHVVFVGTDDSSSPTMAKAATNGTCNC